MRSKGSIWLFLLAVLALPPNVSGCTGAYTEASAATSGQDPRSKPVEQKGALARAANVELGTGPTTVALDASTPWARAVSI
jgi:hypothetical protein